jgi:hypothetical protein
VNSGRRMRFIAASLAEAGRISIRGKGRAAR